MKFDPISHRSATVLRTAADYQREILEVLENKQEKRHEHVFFCTPWVIGQYLRGWQMGAAESDMDVRAFLQEARPQIYKKLVEEILALKGVKFQLALLVQLRKSTPDGSEEYTDLCSVTNRRLLYKPLT
ncbi:MAG: hypothetical protein AB2693_13490 [Candidatus Thiodiazotropha sp.]